MRASTVVRTTVAFHHFFVHVEHAKDAEAAYPTRVFPSTTAAVVFRVNQVLECWQPPQGQTQPTAGPPSARKRAS